MISMESKIQNPSVISAAYERIRTHIHETPVLYSDTLNTMLGNKILFKIDAMQKTGAFKIRGVLNHLLSIKERDKLPEKIVAYSTGNHGLALGFVSKLFGIKARVYLPRYISPVKKRIAKSYGAEVIEVETRQEAEERAFLDVDKGYHYMHPSDSDETIAGAGTMAFEAFKQIKEANLKLPDYIFAPCGGGGLLSGTYLAKELSSPASKLIGCEPAAANDAYRSLKTGSIFRFASSPETIADGLKALSICPRTYSYLKQLDDFILVEDKDIHHWTALLFQLLKVTCEPSSAISMAAAHKLIEEQGLKDKNILIMISGGNIDPAFYKNLGKSDYYLT